MMTLFKSFMKEEDGMGVVEIVLIIAALVAIAILFRNTIIGWVSALLERLFPDVPDAPAIIE